LNVALFPIRKFHFHFAPLVANATEHPTNRARLFRTFARTFAAHFARLPRLHFTDTGPLPTPGARLFLDRFAVPLRIAEMNMRLHEIVDCEVILAVEKPRAPPDDLLELDHRVNRAHQHDIADVAGVHAGREFLRGGQDRRDGFFVVLKIAQMLFAEGAVVRRDPLAVVRVRARLHLVDEIAHGQCVILCRAEHQRLLVLIDLAHENLDALLFALLDLDDLVEVRFVVEFAGLDFTLHYVVVRRIDVVIQRSLNLLHLERREETVVDAVLERVDIDRLAEIGVGVHVILALGRGGEAELHGRGEVIENARQVLSSFAPPRWHSSMTMKSKKSGGYSPK